MNIEWIFVGPAPKTEWVLLGVKPRFTANPAGVIAHRWWFRLYLAEMSRLISGAKGDVGEYAFAEMAFEEGVTNLRAVMLDHRHTEKQIAVLVELARAMAAKTIRKQRATRPVLARFAQRQFGTV